MDNKNTLLQVKDLTVKRGNFLLDHVSLSVRPREIFAILGSTGSGKTLLLEAIAGFYKPEKGEVIYCGLPLLEIPIFRRNIGYLYQDYSLFPHMTAYSNIAYGLKMQGVAKAEIHDRVNAIAGRFGILHLLKQYPGTLSGGEQQRIALARAMIRHPALLLLDEPFSALDPMTRKDIYGIILKIREEFGCAIIFVTHDFTEAEILADKTGILLHGRYRGTADAKDLYTAPWDTDTMAFLNIKNKGDI